MARSNWSHAVELMHNPDPRLLCLSELDLLTTLLYGECRGEPTMGQIAVAWSVKNRVNSGHWYGGAGVHAVALRWAQYSCLWQTLGESNFDQVMAFAGKLMMGLPLTEHDEQLRTVATRVLASAQPDPTQGATHYFDQSIPPPPWTVAPARETIVLGRLHFWAHVA